MHEFAPHEGVGLLAAWVAGLSGSLHCAVMCGPLAASGARGGGGLERASMAFGWHLGRLLAYALVGLLLGLAGQGVAAALAAWVQPVLPWIMAVGFVATAFEFGRRLPAPGALGRLTSRLAALGRGLPPPARALSLGALTPFLPCGLLWGIFLVAVGTGSAPGGAILMVVFGLGGIPGLAAVQIGAAWGGRWPRVERALRIGVPLVAALALVVRAVAGGHAGHGGHLEGPSPGSVPETGGMPHH